MWSITLLTLEFLLLYTPLLSFKVNGSFSMTFLEGITQLREPSWVLDSTPIFKAWLTLALNDIVISANNIIINVTLKCSFVPSRLTILLSLQIENLISFGITWNQFSTQPIRWKILIKFVNGDIKFQSENHGRSSKRGKNLKFSTWFERGIFAYF